MRIIHLSDLHVGKSDSEWPTTLRLLDRLRDLDFDVVVISGDLIDPPDDAKLLADVHGAFEALGKPYVVVPGNHDVQTPGENAAFERHFGQFPRIESISGAQFLLFDSFGGLPIAQRSADDRECFANTGCWGDGFVDASQFASMEADLDDEGPRFAVVHHHLEATPDEKVNALHNAAEFGAWCGAHKVRYAFVGHWHNTAEPRRVHDVTRLRIGRSTRPPYPFALLDTESHTYEISYLEQP